MKIGDKFKTNFTNEIYTIKSFFGKTGIEYSTIQECSIQNQSTNDKMLCIKITETGGACLIKDVTEIIKSS